MWKYYYQLFYLLCPKDVKKVFTLEKRKKKVRIKTYLTLKTKIFRKLGSTVVVKAVF